MGVFCLVHVSMMLLKDKKLEMGVDQASCHASHWEWRHLNTILATLKDKVHMGTNS